MQTIEFAGCTAMPFGSYLKGLAILRLVSEQADPSARGWWDGETFHVESNLDADLLTEFFLKQYRPTPILAPWNGGSGFYTGDNTEGIDAIAETSDERFQAYRDAIVFARSLPEVLSGKLNEKSDEEERRSSILRKCRNSFNDAAVEWLDATVGISADGSRAFAPIVGTGGNEGRLDYTNNSMARVARLLIHPPSSKIVDELLRNALFARETRSLEKGAAGQYDPGRAGGANQGQGIESDSVVNPWDLVLTLEGAVMWASGLYRRQGVSYRSVLCSPFTVRPSRVGYGSAAETDDSRAEIWAPMWTRPASHRELRTLLREGRASVDGRAAKNGIEFAEAARSLGVDRGIEKFVRYSLLKRRGDSYVALPTGIFPTGYKREADHIRQFQNYFEELCRRDLPKGSEDFKRGVESAVFDALLYGGAERMQALMRAFGRMVRKILTTSEARVPRSGLSAAGWLEACGLDSRETVIAGALAGSFKPVMITFVSRDENHFCWTGRDLPERMIAVLEKRLLAIEESEDIHKSFFAIHPGYATLFVEGSVDDDALEELMFAFITFDWRQVGVKAKTSGNFPLPVYDVLRRTVNRRILNLLRADDLTEAARYAALQLRAKREPVMDVEFGGNLDSRRLAAALLIPVWKFKSEDQKKREQELYDETIA